MQSSGGVDVIYLLLNKAFNTVSHPVPVSKVGCAPACRAALCVEERNRVMGTSGISAMTNAVSWPTPYRICWVAVLWGWPWALAGIALGCVRELC